MIKNSNGTINEELVNRFIPVTEDEYNSLLSSKRLKQNAGKRSSKRRVKTNINNRKTKRIKKRFTKRKHIKRKSNKNKK